MTPTNQAAANAVYQAYLERFGQPPVVLVAAPGRINVLGEHLDYNGGVVLPAAIDRYIFLALGPSTQVVSTFYAVDLAEAFTLPAGPLPVSPVAPSWANYLLGVLAQLEATFPQLPPCQLTFGGTIPRGAGLSSSAALECGFAFALDQVFNLGLDRLALVHLAHRAENEFVGLRCGIMDMYASVFGQANQVLALDCERLAHDYLPFASSDLGFVLLDSGVKHALAESAYNQRRLECEQGLAILQEVLPELRGFRAVPSAQLAAFSDHFPAVVLRRSAYVVAEMERVAAAATALQTNDWIGLGALMYATHAGLSQDFAVSCAELDFLVAQLPGCPGVFGARMMGGGFGGCALVLAALEEVPRWHLPLVQAYHNAFGRDLPLYQVKPSAGVDHWGG